MAEALLAEAERAGARVSVLAVGTWLEQYPQIAQRILSGGHDLGNHTMHHLDIAAMDAAGAYAEIAGCAQRLRVLTGSAGRWFRPSQTQYATPLIEREARKAGYQTCVSYDVDSLDYTDPGPDAVVVHRARLGAARVDREPAFRPLRYRDRPARDPERPGQPEAASGHPDRLAVPVTARAARLAGTLAAVLAAGAIMAGCGGSTGVPGPPSAYLGTVVDRPVPAGIADLPLTTDAGRPTSLGAWRGQVVVLADFLTLCQETCPLTTGNLLVMDRAVMAAGLGHRVRFAELTVDPDRDTPARLRAYRALIGAPANLLLLTGRPAVIERIWRYLGVWYQRVGEDSPPGTDWLTGLPLTYDVDHEDALLYIDAAGRVRFVVVGAPNASGAPVAPALLRFLSAQGRADLSHPDASTWTAAEALSPIAWLTGRPIRPAGS